MPIVVTPEVGIPLPFDVTPEEAESFRERAKAACETIKELLDAGAEVEVDDEDSVQAHEIIASERFVPAETRPGAILKLDALLTHYDHEFLDANRKIQNLVTNKLLEETENEDAKVRLKALELLGKRKGVNLFSDQLEVTIKQKPVEEIEGELQRLLGKYMGPVVENTPQEKADPLLTIDLDKELGMHKYAESEQKEGEKDAD